MKLVNETSVEVFYSISGGGAGDCGTIKVGGLVDLPGYDNTENVEVTFSPASPNTAFEVDCGNTQTDQQVVIDLVVE